MGRGSMLANLLLNPFDPAMNKVSNSERDESMDLAKVAMLRRSAVAVLGMILLTDTVVIPQNLPTKDEVAAIGQAQLTNQTKLSHYTWQETQFISIKGEVVDYRLYS